MTVEDVLKKVEEIRETYPTDAHEARDELYVKVLRAVAAGAADSPLLASAALRVEEMDFPLFYS